MGYFNLSIDWIDLIVCMRGLVVCYDGGSLFRFLREGKTSEKFGGETRVQVVVFASGQRRTMRAIVRL